MKKLQTAPLLFLLFLLVSCNKQPTHTSKASIIEGDVDYTMGWGTAEVSYPDGFFLRNSQWISNEPDISYAYVYIKGRVDSMYIGKRVRVIGNVTKIGISGVPSNFDTSILEMDVDSLEMME